LPHRNTAKAVNEYLETRTNGQKGAENVQKMTWKKLIITGLVFGTTLTGSTIWGQTYYVQPGDSLYNIAARFGTTIAALQQSNGLTSTTIYPGQALSISLQGSGSSSSATRYTVKAGDSLYLIAQRYGITVASLKSANNLSSDYLIVGKVLIIPSGSSGTGTSSGSTTHKVCSGESLYLIAQKYGITVEALKQANQLSSNTIWVGQTLTIPAKGSSASAATNSHLVKTGDTLYLIAKQYGISLSDLLKANNLSSSAQIYPGQRLTIPKSGTGSSSGTTVGNYNFSSSDIDLLARLVSAESAGEPFEGQVAVASTILNRLRDPRYPDTIPGIIYQIESGRYQYSPVLDGRINLPATASAIKAVQQAINGWDPSNGANGFYNPSKTSNQWVRSHPVTAVIGNHVFFSY